MDNEEFDYQGRSKEQYERNARIGCFALVTAIGATLAISLLHMFWA